MSRVLTVRVEREEPSQIEKDRLDFGFDSIYFRYAELCDELATYKAWINRTNPIDERNHMDGRKRHFYEALEQLVHAHDNQEEGGSRP